MTSCGTLKVLPPTVTVTGCSVSPSTATLGESIIVEAAVRNDNSFGVDIDADLTAGGTVVNTLRSQSIQAGGTRTFRMSFTASRDLGTGTFDVAFTALDATGVSFAPAETTVTHACGCGQTDSVIKKAMVNHHVRSDL